MNSFFEATNVNKLKKTTLFFIGKVIFLVIVIFVLCILFKVNAHEKKVLENKNEYSIVNDWILCAINVEATVYNAVPAQCNRDFGYTASMFYLDLYDVEAHKIIAMERTFMKEFGLVYGDVVKIEGAGNYNGVYQIQDTMNKRFAGQHKIDILVREDIKYGKWNNVKLYILRDKSNTEKYSIEFKKKISKEENKKQMKLKRKEWKEKKNKKRNS